MRVATRVLRAYLLGGGIPARGCLFHRPSIAPERGHFLGGTPIIRHTTSRASRSSRCLSTQAQASSNAAPGLDHTTTTTTTPTTAYRKHLKDAAKALKKTKGSAETKDKKSTETVRGWETTIGVEIHAQLNTPRKLFSYAPSTHSAPPNTSVSYFDLALPGTLPVFQKETLIPAIRAALALGCDVQRTSRFDRKHYFHWDQPAGYQITQFYEPLAKNGEILLHEHDGIAADDAAYGEGVKIGIKQVQLEQDTAKTITEPGSVHLLDFNRVGLPLIEIITTPCMHTPSTAAAFVRKVQVLLHAADACVLGMESGGLRADVNVSVRRVEEKNEPLGTRTEIKNLSSIKSIHDAIVAERDRQIEVLTRGEKVAGETRGWTIGSTETKRLRGKEGEVDYRYMPDADIPPLVIGEDLIAHLESTMGISPDKELDVLTTAYGLTMKDALSLVALNEGGRIEYFYRVIDELAHLDGSFEPDSPIQTSAAAGFGRMAGNWVLHELGGLIADSSPSSSIFSSPPSDSESELWTGLAATENPLQIDADGNCIVPAPKLASIIQHLSAKKITGKTAKALLQSVFRDHTASHSTEMAKSISQIIQEHDLWFNPLSESELRELFKLCMIGHEKVVEDIRSGKGRGGDGKVMFFVGLMMRKGETGRVDAVEAERVIREVIGEDGNL